MILAGAHVADRATGNVKTFHVSGDWRLGTIVDLAQGLPLNSKAKGAAGHGKARRRIGPPRAERDQSRRRVTEARSTTPAPSIRQASPQTSTAKTTRARLRMVVTTVEMMIME